MSTVGFILAAGSAVCNGSFAALSKVYPTDPQVFNLQFCVGVFLSSLLAPAFYSFSGSEFGVTPYGVIAGLLLVLSTLFSFLAIPRIGLAIGQGVWGGVAIVVSFLWGAIGPDEISNPVKSLPLSSMAIAYLILGVFGMLLSQRYSTTNGDYKESIADDTTSLLVSESGNAGTVQAVQRDTNAGRLLAGLVCAVLVGCFGGSILVPLSFVPDKYSGIGFLPSFGIGAGGSGFLITSCYLLYHRATAPSLTSIVSKSAPGIAAGVVWNVGNVCSILAMGPAGNLSYGVAYPIMQCALFVSGLWGILWFEEIQGTTAIMGFFLSGGVLIGGAVVLSLYGPQPN
eukprot:m.171718 g.171718  ORF g.171718 m.171718 type:complete len:341 (-) comp14819_c0_seq4:73-1095(-)